MTCERVLRPWCDDGRGIIIDDKKNLETGNNSGVVGGVILNAFEMGGVGNDGVGDILAEVSLSKFHFST